MPQPARTREVFEFLTQCAKDMRTVTYEEIAKEVGLAQPGIGRPLGYIRNEICIKGKLPWLNMIVVNKGERRPSEGCFPNSHEFGEEDEPFWRGMVLQVFSYPWETVKFPD